MPEPKAPSNQQENHKEFRNPLETVSLQYGIFKQKLLENNFQGAVSVVQTFVQSGSFEDLDTENQKDYFVSIFELYFEYRLEQLEIKNVLFKDEDLVSLQQTLLEIYFSDKYKQINELKINMLVSMWQVSGVLDVKYLVRKCFDLDCVGYLINKITGFRFDEAEKREIALQIIRNEDEYTVETLISSLNWGGGRYRTTYLTVDTEIAGALINARLWNVLLDNTGKMYFKTKLDKEATLELINNSYYKFLSKVKHSENKFEIDADVADTIVRKFFEIREKVRNNIATDNEYPHTIDEEKSGWKNIVYLNSKFNINNILTEITVILDDGVTEEFYDLAVKISSGESFDWIERLLDKGDNTKGLKRLESAISQYTKKVLNGDFNNEDVKEMMKNSYLKSIFKKIIRYDYSQFGSHDDVSFEKTVETFLKLQSEEKLKPLPQEFVIGEIRPHKVEEISVNYGKNFKTVYEEVINIALSITTDRKSSFTNLITSMDFSIIPNMKDFLKNLKTESANPKRVEYLENVIKQLDEHKLKGRESLEASFILLINIREESIGKELKDKLNKILIELILKTNSRKDSYFTNLDKFTPLHIKEPTRDELSELISYIDHSLLQEFLIKKGYIKTKEGIKAFRSLFKLSVLEEQLANWKTEVSKDITPTKIIPSRDIFTEFSGHTGDACWADKYPSICQYFPNIVSYTLVQNPDNKNIRVAGSFLTIDTIDVETKEPVMVIRGLNPIENYINQVDPESFFKDIVNYLQLIAKKRGMKLAIVIDDHCGGASTNRPALYDYLSPFHWDSYENFEWTEKCFEKCKVSDSIPNNYEWSGGGDEPWMPQEISDYVPSENEKFGNPNVFNGYKIGHCTWYIPEVF